MSLKEFVKKETVFCISLLLAAASILFVPPGRLYFTYPDYRTLALLFCLMAVVGGMQSIGVFTLLGQKLLSGTRGTRKLSLLLVFLCFFSSMVITNDVALITFVPFTILVYQMVGMERRLIRLIVLETVAANLGSMATPVGNPQNLYLYSVSGILPADFFRAVLPYAALSLILLAIAVWREKDETIRIQVRMGEMAEDRKPFFLKLAVYLFLFFLCLLVVAHLLPWPSAFLAVVLCMCVKDRAVLQKIDYFLLMTFLCFFIFIGNMKQIEAVSRFLSALLNGHELLTGIAACQVISNVPAAILLSGFTDQYQTLLTAVNLGGLGTPIASLASLISFQFFAREYEAEKGRYLAQFIFWNVLFLVVLTAAALLLYSL